MRLKEVVQRLLILEPCRRLAQKGESFLLQTVEFTPIGGLLQSLSQLFCGEKPLLVQGGKVDKEGISAERTEGLIG